MSPAEKAASAEAAYKRLQKEADTAKAEVAAMESRLKSGETGIENIIENKRNEAAHLEKKAYNKMKDFMRKKQTANAALTQAVTPVPRVETKRPAPPHGIDAASDGNGVPAPPPPVQKRRKLSGDLSKPVPVPPFISDKDMRPPQLLAALRHVGLVSDFFGAQIARLHQHEHGAKSLHARTLAAAPDQSQHQQKRLGALVRSAKTVHKLFDNLSVRSAAELPSQLAPSADPVLIRLALVGSQSVIRRFGNRVFTHTRNPNSPRSAGRPTNEEIAASIGQSRRALEVHMRGNGVGVSICTVETFEDAANMPMADMVAIVLHYNDRENAADWVDAVVKASGATRVLLGIEHKLGPSNKAPVRTKAPARGEMPANDDDDMSQDDVEDRTDDAAAAKSPAKRAIHATPDMTQSRADAIARSQERVGSIASVESLALDYPRRGNVKPAMAFDPVISEILKIAQEMVLERSSSRSRVASRAVAMGLWAPLRCAVGLFGAAACTVREGALYSRLNGAERTKMASTVRPMALKARHGAGMRRVEAAVAALRAQLRATPSPHLEASTTAENTWTKVIDVRAAMKAHFREAWESVGASASVDELGEHVHCVTSAVMRYALTEALFAFDIQLAEIDMNLEAAPAPAASNASAAAASAAAGPGQTGQVSKSNDIDKICEDAMATYVDVWQRLIELRPTSIASAFDSGCTHLCLIQLDVLVRLHDAYAALYNTRVAPSLPDKLRSANQRTTFALFDDAAAKRDFELVAETAAIAAQNRWSLSATDRDSDASLTPLSRMDHALSCIASTSDDPGDESFHPRIRIDYTPGAFMREVMGLDNAHLLSMCGVCTVDPVRDLPSGALHYLISAQDAYILFKTLRNVYGARPGGYRRALDAIGANGKRGFLKDADEVGAAAAAAAKDAARAQSGAEENKAQERASAHLDGWHDRELFVLLQALGDMFKCSDQTPTLNLAAASKLLSSGGGEAAVAMRLAAAIEKHGGARSPGDVEAAVAALSTAWGKTPDGFEKSFRLYASGAAVGNAPAGGGGSNPKGGAVAGIPFSRIERAIEWLAAGVNKDINQFTFWASDLLVSLYYMSQCAVEETTRALCLRYAAQTAARWKNEFVTNNGNPDVVRNMSCEMVFFHLQGLYGLAKLGRDDSSTLQYKRVLLRHAQDFEPAQYLGCTIHQLRQNRWSDVLDVASMEHPVFRKHTFALVSAYFMEQAGHVLPGASVVEMVALGRDALLPYRRSHQLKQKPFMEQCYYATHVVFVKTQWCQFPLDASDPEHAPEYAFLAEALVSLVKWKEPDIEIIGEVLQVLKCYGVSASTPGPTGEACAAAVSLLLQSQDELSGTWNASVKEFGVRYHTTICAIGGLLNHTYRDAYL